jgi:hypothetical protein
LVWFFRTKTGSNWYGSVFFRVFQFQAYKTETEPVGFLKVLISFFHDSILSIIFFQFSRFNQFFNFFLTSSLYKHRLGLGSKEPQSDTGEERTRKKKKKGVRVVENSGN